MYDATMDWAWSSVGEDKKYIKKFERLGRYYEIRG
jgi:hypothetical protein